MGGSETKLSPPWVTFFREIEALFGEDPDIKIEFDEAEYEVRLFVEGTEKADALDLILPSTKTFGNIEFKITIIPANAEVVTKARIFQNAFAGNPVLSYVSHPDNVFHDDINYIVFRNRVVQFFNDNLGDVNGNCSTLYQEIAKDVFGNDPNVFFCTDIERNIGKPLPNQK